MKVTPRGHRGNAQLVTEARLSRTEDISQRARRYLVLMAIRVVCFLVAILLFVRGAGLVALIPAVGAIVIPYFAVVFANGGREPNRSRGFREYQPNLPAVHLGSDHMAQGPQQPGPGTDGTGTHTGDGTPASA